MKSKTFATSISKILLHVGCTIIDIAVQSTYSNIELFSSFRITPDNFPANKKDRPLFLRDLERTEDLITFLGRNRQYNAKGAQ